jgi:hypothetical protein
MCFPPPALSGSGYRVCRVDSPHLSRNNPAPRAQDKTFGFILRHDYAPHYTRFCRKRQDVTRAAHG